VLTEGTSIGNLDVNGPSSLQEGDVNAGSEGQRRRRGSELMFVESATTAGLSPMVLFSIPSGHTNNPLRGDGGKP
jgi:hypothetical protein